MLRLQLHRSRQGQVVSTARRVAGAAGAADAEPAVKISGNLGKPAACHRNLCFHDLSWFLACFLAWYLAFTLEFLALTTLEIS